MLREGQKVMRLPLMRMLLAMALFLSGCADIRETYAPPKQRKPLAGPDTTGLKHFVAFSDPDAKLHILRDVGDDTGSGTRWTGQKPTLQFYLREVKNLKVVMDFALADVILKSTGPLTVTYFVNGRQIEKTTYTKGGQVTVEKDVRADWLVKGGVNVLSAELDKIYVAPEDQARLGLLLVRAGFRE
jgi:hypothetical protein